MAKKTRTVKLQRQTAVVGASAGPQVSSGENERDPSHTSLWYEAMSPRWLLMNDLLGGTDAMREARTRRLPKHPEETDDSWTRRLNAAVLFNVTQMTADTLTGFPFSEPIQLGQDIPTRIKDFCENIDLRGTHLDVFARQWFFSALTKGFSHVLVDHPMVAPREDGAPRTLADDQKEGLRPYWVMIQPEDLIAARAQVINGHEVLTHIRYRQEVVVVAEDGFEESVVQQIHVREPGVHQVWTLKHERGKDIWVPEAPTSITLPGGKPAPITLVTLYASRNGFMISKPPLEDLGHLNVAHWQSYADQRNILTVARFPMLAASGVEDDDGILAVGPNQMLIAEDAQARYYYVEHGGKAIESGRQDLLDLEQRMSAYGADFLRKRPTVYTATGRVLDQAGIFSPLQVMTISARDAIETALDYTALWIGEADGGSVKLNMEFSPKPVDSADLASLQKTWEDGLISDETYVNELIRRKTLSPDLDITKELAQVEQRRAARAALNNPPAPVKGPGANPGGVKPPVKQE